MIDITDKYPSLRSAEAEARLYLPPEAATAVRDGTVPKGNILEFCRAVAMLAVKKTPELLPFCHPVQIDHVALTGFLDSSEYVLRLTVKAIDRTGVEVEAMTGVALAALNAYDMLKPLADGVEIRSVRLLTKKGGKTSFKGKIAGADLGVLVVVLSDSVAAGHKEDSAGRAIVEELQHWPCKNVQYKVLSDDPEPLRELLLQAAADDAIDLILTTGGTGLGPRDNTVAVLRTLLDREIEGVGEWIRSFGGRRTPLAVLSNALCGLLGTTLVVALPGSTRGARESMQALYPWFIHLFDVIEKGYRHADIDNS